MGVILNSHKESFPQFRAAGILIATIGSSSAVIVAGVGYLLALAIPLALRPHQPESDESSDNKPNLWSSTLAGAKYAFSDRPLITLLVVIVVLNLGFIGPFAIALPAHVLDELGGAPTTLAWLQSGFAGGSILGAVIVASIWKKPGSVALVGSVLTVAICQMAVAIVGVPALAVLALCIVGVASGIVNVVIVAAIQRRTDKSYIGRVVSLVMVLSMGLAPVSHALTGSLVLAFAPWIVIFEGAVLTFNGGLSAIPIVSKVLPKVPE